MKLSKLIEEVKEQEKKVRSGEIFPYIYTSLTWASNDIEIYDAEYPKRIREKLAGIIDSEHIDDILAAIERTPTGEAWINDSLNDNERIYFSILWYTFRKSKFVTWYTQRYQYSYRSERFCMQMTTDGTKKCFIWSILFRKRKILLDHYKCVRQLRHLGVRLPEDEVLVDIVDVEPHYRLAYVQGAFWYYWLLTPLGAFPVASRKVETVAGAFNKVTDQHLPRGKKVSWEDIEPIFIMAALVR